MRTRSCPRRRNSGGRSEAGQLAPSALPRGSAVGLSHGRWRLRAVARSVRLRRAGGHVADEGRSMKYLSARQIADELGISKSASYDLMQKLPRFVDGRIVRVPEPAFRRYREGHTVGPWQNSTSGAKSGGTSSAGAGSQLAAPTGKPPNLRLVSSNDGPQIPLTKPRTKPRSSGASSSSSGSKQRAGARRGQSR